MLTSEKIASLASAKGVRKIAVQNFLGSLGSERNALEARMNLSADAQSYGWNAATVSAIRKGIDLFFKKAA